MSFDICNMSSKLIQFNNDMARLNEERKRRDSIPTNSPYKPSPIYGAQTPYEGYLGASSFRYRKAMDDVTPFYYRTTDIQLEPIPEPYWYKWPYIITLGLSVFSLAVAIAALAISVI